MPSLPASSDFTGGAVTEGQFKTALTALRDYLSGLLGADGVNATALATLGALGAGYAAKAAAYTVVVGDCGKVLNCSGTWTLSLPAAATAGAGFSFAVRVETGTITIDPSGAELIDGTAAVAMVGGRSAWLISTGTEWLRMTMPKAQNTATDITADRLMAVGAFGLGANAAILVTDYDAITATGVYRNGAVATGSPIASSLYWSVLHLAHSSDGTSSQFAMRSAGTTANQMYFRRKAGGVWSPWDKVFHSGNLLGTVSQTGGAPTGAVIERGSNANGEYVKFADGTMICSKTITGQGPISTASGSLFIQSPGLAIGALPAAFIAIPARSLDVYSPVGVSAWVQSATAPTTTTGGTVQLVKSATSAATDFVLTATFIGRWF
ncbi:MAG: hypothetical protein FD162_1325 [Rhodobacteraceae bacterium]|nr:MAG: hypothetical protein FD162_1325 [Paracoccaceae bacterium]